MYNPEKQIKAFKKLGWEVTITKFDCEKRKMVMGFCEPCQWGSGHYECLLRGPFPDEPEEVSWDSLTKAEQKALLKEKRVLSFVCCFHDFDTAEAAEARGMKMIMEYKNAGGGLAGRKAIGLE